MAVKKYKEGSPAKTHKDGTAAAVLGDPVKKLIKNVRNEANSTAQFFWHMDGTDEEAGAHVTEIPKEKFLKNPQGGNLLLRSNSVRIRNGQQILSEFSDNRVTLASGKGIIKYTEDGSAFGLQDSHRIVLCKGTDEPEVRNDATISSMDIENWDNTKPMAFFNVTHSVVNGVKSAGGGLFVFDGSGNIRFLTLTDDNVLEVSGDVKAGSISVYDLDTAVEQHGEDIAALQDDFAAMFGNFVQESHELFASTSISGSSYKSDEAEFSKAGYYPIAVAGWTSSASQFCPARLYLSEQDIGTAKVKYMIRNTDTSAHSGSVSVYILWAVANV